MKAVIMAGGKGTRIASVTNDEIPKPMLKVGDKPILEHQIKCLKANGVNEIVIVVGHLGRKIEEYFGSGEKMQIKINYIYENKNDPLGTAGALYYLKDKITDDFILVFGDVYFDVDFRKMVKFHREHRAMATLLTHPNSHPYDSDLVIVGENDVVIRFDSKENDRTRRDYQNIVNSGIYVLAPSILNKIEAPQKMSLEKDVISKCVNCGTVFSYHSTEYAKDMGTPERYKAVNRDYAIGLPEIRNLRNRQKCIFLDRDGTINEYRGIIADSNDLVLVNGVAEAIRMVNNSEYLCIVVTNQPVVARGECDEKGLAKIHRHLETLLGREGAYIDGLFYCPHHPDKGFDDEVPELKINCECRKPKIGMVKKAAEQYNIDLSASYMIGDSWRDVETGENAGMTTCWLESGEEENEQHPIKSDMKAKDLLEAIKLILERR